MLVCAGQAIGARRFARADDSAWGVVSVVRDRFALPAGRRVADRSITKNSRPPQHAPRAAREYGFEVLHRISRDLHDYERLVSALGIETPPQLRAKRLAL